KAGDDEAAYSSLMIATIGGTRQVIAFMADALLGFDRATGAALWRVPLTTNAKRHTGTPVISGDMITVNSHTFGLSCFKISRDSTGFNAEQLWNNKDMKINLA